MKGSIKDSSYATFQRAWSVFEVFYQEFYACQPVWPVSETDIIWFCTYLSICEYAPSTIHTYVSAINHMNRLKGQPSFTSSFLVRKVLDGIDATAVPKPLRAPITPELLDLMLTNLPHMGLSFYEYNLFQAVFTFMFFTCARVGEIAISHGQAGHVLSLSDIEVINQKNPNEHILVHFVSFKHNKSNTRHSIPVTRRSGPFCPVSLLFKYLTLRGLAKGPLFIRKDGATLSSTCISNLLKKCLKFVGHDPAKYGTHSFRIGRCSDLAKQGASDTEIRFLGRFHSDAFLKYVRPQVFGGGAAGGSGGPRVRAGGRRGTTV